MRATRLGAVGLLIFIADLACGAQAVHRLGPNFRFLPVLLQGTPGFSTTPASPIDLGPSAVGMTTPHAFSLQLQINNPGSAALSISSFSFFPAEAGFTAESTFLPPFSIAAGSSKPTAVLFTPQGAGKRTVQLSVSDNAPGSPHIVQFTGTGVTVQANDYAVILDPGVRIFGECDRWEQHQFPCVASGRFRPGRYQSYCSVQRRTHRNRLQP